MKNSMMILTVLTILFMQGDLQCATPKNIIILIDTQKESLPQDFTASQCKTNTDSWGPVTGSLVAALFKKEAPILVSGSVWRNFIERRKLFRDLTGTQAAQLYDAYKKRYPCFADKNQFLQLQKKFAVLKNPTQQQQQLVDQYIDELLGFYVPGTIAFEPSEWTMKKLSSSGTLFLLIPKTNDNRHVKGLELTQFPDVIDMRKVDDFPQVDGQQTIVTETTIKKDGKIFTQQSTEIKSNVDLELIPILQNLFVLNKTNTDAPYEWFVYLNGHGSPAARSTSQVAFIAGLREETFK